MLHGIRIWGFCCMVLAGVVVAGVGRADPAVLSLKDFGAVGDGKANDLPAFLSALAKAKALSGTPVTLRVPDGTYRLELGTDAPERAHLLINQMADLTVEADTLALLVCTSPYHRGVSLAGCKNVTLRKLAVDYDPLPFTQGIVMAVTPEKKWIDLKLDEGFLAPTAQHLDCGGKGEGKKTAGKNVGYVFDPVTAIKLNEFYDQYLRTPVQDLGCGVYRFTSDNEVAAGMEGKRFAVIGRRNADAFSVEDSEDCLLEGLEVYSAPACGFKVNSSAGITLDRCAIKQRPGTARVMSTNADGLHSKWCRVGPTLSNSYFTGMGDDSVNIGGSYAPVVEQPDANTVIVDNHGSLQNFALEAALLDMETHGHLLPGVVLEIKNAKVADYPFPCLKITFEKPLPTLTTWRMTNDRHKCQQIINLNACGRGGKVINNHFYNHRVRGVLMRGPNGVIRGNRFDTLAGPGIVISNDIGFLFEGPSGDGTVVEDNVFTKVQRSNIWILSSSAGKTNKATQGIVGVKIVNNRFEEYGGTNAHGRGVCGNVLYVSNATDLLIKDNVIGKPLEASVPAAAVIMNRVGDVSWEGNTIQGRPLDPKTDVETADVR